MDINHKSGWPFVLDSKEVIDLVGIAPNYLNKIVERGAFGFSPSIRKGSGRGSRRLYSQKDVCEIAVVWWLFQSGFRSQVISDIFRALEPERALASRLSRVAGQILGDVLQKREPKFLVVTRELPRPSSKSRRGVALVSRPHLGRVSSTASNVIVPVGDLMSELIRRIRARYPRGADGR